MFNFLEIHYEKNRGLPTTHPGVLLPAKNSQVSASYVFDQESDGVG